MRKNKKIRVAFSLFLVLSTGCFDNPNQNTPPSSVKSDLEHFDQSVSDDGSMLIDIVPDTEPPQLTLVGSQTVFHFLDDPFVDPGALAADDVDGDLSLKIETESDLVNQVGDYKVRYSVSDNAGNRSEITRVIYVRAAAESLTLSTLFSSNMVLQRDEPIRIWGEANAGGLVHVSFAEQSIKTIVPDNGRWEVAFDKVAAPFTGRVSIRSATQTVLENVAMGDVWVCAGQSNMAWGIWRLTDYNLYRDYDGDFGKVRYYISDQGNQRTRWTAARPDINSVERLSQVAYFFARDLHDSGVEVPIGIIQSAVGSSSIQQWRRGGDLYERMINPLTKLKTAGVLWYQGEADLTNEYPLTTLISEWREAWSSSFPFYIAQISSFGEPSLLPSDSKWAEVREAQRDALSGSNTGLAVTVDIGDGTYHPPNKQEVGRRLSVIARANLYQQNIPYSGPNYRSHDVEGSSMRLHFDHIGQGIVPESTLNHFAIAGADGVYVWADALVEGETVLVSADGVTNPVSVRYAWSDNPNDINFYNEAGFPAVPFVTEMPQN